MRTVNVFSNDHMLTQGHVCHDTMIVKDISQRSTGELAEKEVLSQKMFIFFGSFFTGQATGSIMQIQLKLNLQETKPLPINLLNEVTIYLFISS